MSLKSNIAKVSEQSSIRTARAAYAALVAETARLQSAAASANAALETAMTKLETQEKLLHTLYVNKINALQMRTPVGHSFVTLAAVDLAEDGTISKRYPAMMYVKTASKLIPALPEEGKSLRRQLRALRNANL